jgi:hypothetical protein
LQLCLSGRCLFRPELNLAIAPKVHPPVAHLDRAPAF